MHKAHTSPDISTKTCSKIISTRRALLLFCDIKDGTLQGDPDSKNNEQRTDPEMGQAVCTPPMFHRKIRDRLALAGYEIYDARGACFQRFNEEVAASVGINLRKSKSKRDGGDGVKLSPKDAEKMYAGFCERFIDWRLFGGTVPGVPGTTRGTVHFSWTRSIDVVNVQVDTITRQAVATLKEEKQQGGANHTIGKLSSIPYGLFRGHGYVDQHDAVRNRCTESDYAILLNELVRVFDNDKSFVRSQTCLRALYEIDISNDARGPVHIEQILEAIRAQRRDMNKVPRSFEDYRIVIPKKIEARASEGGDFRFRRIVSEVNPWLDASEAAE